MYEKIFKHPYLMMYMCNLFEILKHYCRHSIPTDVMMLGLPGATITFVDEIIRMMNICH